MAHRVVRYTGRRRVHKRMGLRTDVPRVYELIEVGGRRSPPVSYRLVVSLGFQEHCVEAGLVLLV